MCLTSSCCSANGRRRSNMMNANLFALLCALVPCAVATIHDFDLNTLPSEHGQAEGSAYEAAASNPHPEPTSQPSNAGKHLGRSSASSVSTAGSSTGFPRSSGQRGVQRERAPKRTIERPESYLSSPQRFAEFQAKVFPYSRLMPNKVSH